MVPEDGGIQTEEGGDERLKARTADGIRLIPTEEEEQRFVISWAEVNEYRYPELKLLYHIPNEGKRSVREGARMKRIGLRKGISDLCLPVARGIYHGLYIELKVLNGRITKEQNEFLAAVREQGYCGFACYGGVSAVKVIEQYLELDNKREEET